MSMVGTLSSYTASLSSNTTLLRDGQTLSVAVPSGLSVSAGNILGLSRKTLKKDKKRKINYMSASTQAYLEKRAKRPPVSGNVLLTKRPVHINPRGGNCSSDSDDEDGVMELLGESRTRKPSSTPFAATPAVTSSAATVAPAVPVAVPPLSTPTTTAAIALSTA